MTFFRPLLRMFAIGVLAIHALHTVAAEPVSFSRLVQPILAAHCYECHGPDASSRKANLRLDDRESAIAMREGDVVPIVPGRPDLSALLVRVLANDDSRMPPPEHDPLSTAEIETLRKWIEQGANWDRHWAFLPLHDGGLNSQHLSSANFIDEYLRRSGHRMRKRASDATLLRRAFLGVIGLPPTHDELSQFLRDEQPDAYARLVDRLLDSPHYGERWGRHWLDVARYADSNGGDENHAYPHAHRYRDYVIDAFNRDTPYDVFILEQLAGDLLPTEGVGTDIAARRIAATGYLAIGMKILAEQDPVKKQADIVDEQIDTFGRTFLGLSLGCARCHDHKFDPILSKDYYALAGVFHSTIIEDRDLPDEGYQRRLSEHEAKRTTLQAGLKRLESRLGKSVVAGRQAEQFDRGNVVIDSENYGKGIGIISDPGGQLSFVEYDIDVRNSGEYRLELRYSAAVARPGRILLDGDVVIQEAIANTTGNWFPDSQTWHSEGVLSLTPGPHVLRIESKPMMSHIDQWRILSAAADQELLDELERHREALNQLDGQKPRPPTAMAVQDGEGRDVQIHRRGSHLDLGEVVARGAIGSLGGDGVSIGYTDSGRLQLARWLTSPDSPPSSLAARVIVNRVWHWHFGKGLVASTDDFGLRGDVPKQGKLLDTLALYLIRNDWSLKALHRQILLSQAYQQIQASNIESADEDIFAARRLEPEVIRDAMLVAAGQLDRRMFNAPMQVKSQDPSPQDAAANQQFYVDSRRRSVYLPVVRTNVYDFFTLFNFPNVATPQGRRDETTVPTQALWMLNSRFVDEMSRALADRVLQHHFASDRDALDFVTRAVISRNVQSAEVGLLSEALAQFRTASYETDELARERGAWSMLIQTLFMSSEAMDAP